MPRNPQVYVHRGKVQPIWAGHPWVYAQAIERVEGAPKDGDVVDVTDPKGGFLGRGFFAPKSALAVRIGTRREDEDLDRNWLRRRIEGAIEMRKQLGIPNAHTNGYRLVHAEGDGLPGLIVDIMDRAAIVQIGIAGFEPIADELYALLQRLVGVETVIRVAPKNGEATEAATPPSFVRGKEVQTIRFRERDFEFEIEAAISQKTGFYFDQRDNRRWVEGISKGAKVLDLYSFVGAFGMAAARGGATSVISVDSSAPALATAARNAHRAGLGDRIQFEKSDARKSITRYLELQQTFDVVIVDPPKLAPTIRHLERARAAYRKLNADAARLVSPGGFLVTCSCSAALHSEDFARTLAFSISDAGREATLIHMGSQTSDHPVLPAFPEGRYLKAAFLKFFR